jgi:hypothetical protein
MLLHMTTKVYNKEELSPNKLVKPKKVINPSLQHYTNHFKRMFANTLMMQPMKKQ